VLMDVQMPVMDGLTATREIRQDGRFADLPILAMTANAMSGDRELCLEAGMQDHIAKPVDPGAMYATLARWIKPASPQPVPRSAELTEGETESLALPDVPGLDTRAGLQRMGGNLKGYLGLLARFRSNQGEAGTAIRDALAGDDVATAERLAHTVKGVAGAIGATALAEQAGRLESAIRELAGPAQIEPLLHTMTAELVGLCTVLDRVLPAALRPESDHPVAAEGAEQVDRRDQLFREAARQLAIFDAAVEHTLTALRGCSLSGEASEWVSKLEKQVAQYDLEGAAVTLQQCATALGVTLEEAA
ncbi:MAG: response regulator, partial [Magnetococcus sp. DMHC-8]